MRLFFFLNLWSDLFSCEALKDALQQFERLEVSEFWWEKNTKIPQQRTLNSTV